ncbi:MAG: DUF4880 domain-containing protein [Pseudomonas sp.]|uniref:DUF4880 domain-containing protein n=1 Tax=Pseudomonas abieticivorans TaxID=2931382 RepID=UPI0020BF35A0|nr:sigma-70 region 4 domain-containing protein [Pseudomonas sp. PIA16]MDE1168042.1 DUF4880 domain-containing protein [Pseudomonas sp.]
MTVLSPLHNLFAHSPLNTDADFLALKKLPRRVQQVFLLSRLDDLPYAAIAERLDQPLASVEKSMRLALGGSAGNAQANQWYVKLQSPLTTASDRIDFRRWLDAAPEHLAAFRATELRWRTLQAPARRLGASAWYRQPRRHTVLAGWLAGLVTLGLIIAGVGGF